MVYFEQKVRFAARQRKLNVSTLSEAMGIDRNTMYNKFNAPVVESEFIAQLCQILKVHPSYFDSKEQYPDFEKYDLTIRDNKTNALNEPAGQYFSQGNIIFVPLVAYGGFLFGYSNKVFMDSLQRFALPGIFGEHYAFEIDGMSMHEMMTPGDWAIARQEEQLYHMIKGKAYVLVTVDGILVKLFDKLENDRAYFHSYNKDYNGIDLPLKSIKRLYFVVKVLKNPYT